mmetsp:Transcript_21201/g.55145  ORF Transcript_21201/g.55145 Transcript_21201/m.55145 type:complete len:98 (-) Transcript_21201:1974-2267(-)
MKSYDRMTMDELKLEFIVCLRANQPREALRVGNYILEREPNNDVVREFQARVAATALDAKAGQLEGKLPPHAHSSTESESEESESEEESGEEIEERV